MNWLKRLWSRNRQIQISVRLGPDLRDLFEWAATREGMTVEAWALRTLTAAIPKAEVKKLREAALREAGLEAVFARLDSEELAAGMAPTKQELAQNARLTAPQVPGHPCVHLKSGAPLGFRTEDCQGTCGSPKQEGRVCHWVAQVAPQCPAYGPRFDVIHDRR